MKYYVIAECSPLISGKYKLYFWLHGMKWNHATAFTGMLTAFSFNRIKQYCDLHRLKCYIANEMGIRGSSYRRDFFANNKPIDKYGRYRCVYCGRKLRPERITVDHIYPIGAVRSNIRLQKRLNKKGIYNINDVKNLVPACMKCNKKKGTQMGSWLIRAQIGKNEIIWKIRIGFRWLFGILLCVLIYWLFIKP